MTSELLALARKRGYKGMTLYDAKEQGYLKDKDVSVKEHKRGIAKTHRFKQTAQLNNGRTIRFNLWNSRNEDVSGLPDYEIDRISKLVLEGYSSGDIFIQNETDELNGWWEL